MRMPGKGSIKRSSCGFPERYADLRRIVVAFDEEMFTQIRDRALKAQTSFAEQVRILATCGLEAREQ